MFDWMVKKQNMFDDPAGPAVEEAAVQPGGRHQLDEQPDRDHDRGAGEPQPAEQRLDHGASVGGTGGKREQRLLTTRRRAVSTLAA